MKNPATGKLREKAEALYRLKDSEGSFESFESDAIKLLHELEVYEIELELNNEELLLARNESEALAKKYTALYDFAPTGYLTINDQGVIVELNFSASKLLGKERGLIVGTDLTQYISSTDSRKYNDFFKNIFSSKTKQVCEIQLVSGKEDMEAHCLLEGIVNEEDTNCLIALVDTTQLKINEKELIKARNKAEESDQIKSDFLSNMSHEIRTPINAILGFSQLQGKEGISKEERKMYLDSINTSSKRLLHLVSDILDISRIESGQLSYAFNPCNINRLLDHLQAEFEVFNDNPEISIKISKGLSDEKCVITTDEQRLLQILSNLIENALKFTTKGTVEFGYVAKNDQLQFYVKDSGIGIKFAEQQLIFKRFEQAKQNNSKLYGGTGLGLSIVKGLVELLSGEIWVESEFNNGSTFYFTIADQSQHLSKPEIMAPVSTDLEGDLANKLILVVEDNYLNNLLLNKLLTLPEHNCQVLSAYNGQQAIDLVRENSNIDLILLDLNMPVVNGYEAIKQIRQINADITIIAQTGFGLPEDIKNIKRAGFDDYLIKPLSEGQLISILKQHLLK
ncbi:MAG: ATP-binding protein [Cyclobacteriaceae bacterium]